MITLTSDVAREIARHAEETYPDECVGLLLGRLEGTDKIVTTVFPAENSWQGQVSLAETDDAASRRDRFYLDPRDYLRADREARAQGFDVVGCYHSHPDDAAHPSERDRIGAQGAGGGPGFAFVIQSVQQGKAAEMASWLLLHEGTQFEQEILKIVHDET
jgi:proteasome lid subunit RPN8/RPN11